MKNFLKVILFVCMLSVASYAQQYSFSGSVTSTGSAPGRQTSYNIQSTGVGYWIVSYVTTGSPASCTFSLQHAPDNATWSSYTGLNAVTCTSSGVTSGSAQIVDNNISINFSALSNGGTVNYTVQGWILNPATSGSSSTNATIVGPLGSALSAASVSVVIASDQAAVAVKQPTAASLNATVVGTGTFAVQATGNVTQFGGTNISTGTGAGGAGIPRVTVSNDSTVGLVAGSAIVGKFGIDQTTPGTTNAVNINNAGDPCQNPNVAKSNAIINITTATTTSIVGISGSTAIYACGYYFAAQGTTATYQWEYGTGGTCGTGTTILTGAVSVTTTATPHSALGGFTMFKAPASNGLCLVSTGTSPIYNGWLTYVQQ